MIWAILVALGVPLWLIAVCLLGLFMKRRHVVHTPGAFPCRVRVAMGDIGGLKDKFRSAHGLWAHDVLVVYTNMGRTNVLPLPTRMVEQPFQPVEVKHLDDAQLLALQLDDGAVVEIAVATSDQSLAVGPFLGVALASELSR